MRVLYVEDDPLDSDLTRRELGKTAPYISLTIASTLEQALACLERDLAYDLMLTDLRLPDGRGFDLLAHVRSQGLPMAVVVITGQGDEETAVAVMKAGADSFVVKRQNYLRQLPLILSSALQSYQQAAARRAHTLRVLYMDQSSVENEQTRSHFNQHAQYIQLEILYTQAELYRRLDECPADPDMDVLLLDYRLDNLEALELLKELRQVRQLDVPIVLVTSHGDQEVAAQALRLGATDYVVKSEGYLYRLPGLLENAYHYSQLLREQAALRSSEERFRALIENSADGTLVMDAGGVVLYSSPSCERLLGYAWQDFLGKNLKDCLHPDDQPVFQQNIILQINQPGVLFRQDYRIQHSSGSWRWIGTAGMNLLQNNAVRGIVVNYRDITERYLAQERIRRQVQRLQALREIDIAITTGMELRQILDTILLHATVQLGVHAADILLYEAKTQELHFGAERGFDRSTSRQTRLSLGKNLAGKAVLERRILSFPNPALPPESDPGYLLPSNFQSEGFQVYYAAPLITKREIKGVLEVFHRQSLEPDEEWLNFLETLAGQAAIAIDSDQMLEGLIQTNLKLELAYDQTLQGWMRFLDQRDEETHDHTQRLVQMTEELAARLGVNGDALLPIRRGALLHDLGKIGVPDSILRKPGSLSEDEWEKMRLHPVIAYDMLSSIDYLRPVLDIPYCHHEKWDGSGYPRGLKGEQIPLAARIFAVVDVYDALLYDRPYRLAWDEPRVIEHIRFLSGSHFDPRVVETFLNMLLERSH